MTEHLAMSPPSPTIVSKLKHHVPKRLSLSRSPSTSPPQTKNQTIHLLPPLPAPLKIRFESARDLLAKDKNGKSDPFIKSSLITQSSVTPLQSAILINEKSRLISDIRHTTLEPIWYQSDLNLDLGSSTLEIILFPNSLHHTSIKAILFDKDRVRNDYLGELEINLMDWFQQIIHNQQINPIKALSFDSIENQSHWIHLTSSKQRIKVSGQVKYKIGFTSNEFFKNLSNHHSNAFPNPILFNDIQKTMEEIYSILLLNHQNLMDHQLLGEENDTESKEKQEKSLNKLVKTNKKLREILVRKIRRKSNHHNDLNTDPTNDDEAELVAVLSAHPEEGVGTMAQAGSVTGPELSEAIGEVDGSDHGSLSSIISTDSESEEEEEADEIENVVGNAAHIPLPSDLVTNDLDHSIPISKNNNTLSVPPILSRTSSSSSSSKKLLSLPSTISKKIIPRSIIIKPKVRVEAPINSGSISPVSPTTTKKTKKMISLRKQKSQHSFKHGHLSKDDVIGICFVEIDRAIGLPYRKSVTRIGFDMDPFVIISFGEKIFRTKVIRHSLDPIWNESLFFHVKRNEEPYSILFSLFDWDKLSSNDYIGEAKILMKELIETKTKTMYKNPKTGLYEIDSNGKLIGDSNELYEFPIGNENGKLFLKARYVPYDGLRQIFWRKYLESFDIDESNTISQIELISMLDSLGSTLSSLTIKGFFNKFNKSESDTLTIEEVIICLESELGKRPEEKRRIKRNVRCGEKVEEQDQDEDGEEEETFALDHDEVPLGLVGASPVEEFIEIGPGSQAVTGEECERVGSGEEDEETEVESDGLEKVISISRCPICHKERIDSRLEIDIVTHLAVCASTDWSSLRHMLSPGRFVTSNQANRKWFTKVIGQVQNGRYSIGADSANIIIKERLTGNLIEEKMQVIVRLGIRLMYRSSGSKNRMEKERVKKLLKSLTLKQGIKYDSIESKKEIENFINFHQINVLEILKPIESFKTFNEFFYRELKPNSRIIEFKEDSKIIISCADCRMMSFENILKSKLIWIKGRSFSLEKVLGDKVLNKDNDQLNELKDESYWSLSIFRLAPQDYHRFHSPVDGIVEAIERIDGKYYTVNPMAIRSTIDVYGENVRVIVVIKTEFLGTIYCVLVGAMMVGSIEVGVKVGDRLTKGDHLGYFAFGGSTILVIGKSDLIEWDDDLLENSRVPIETLVRVGNKVGGKKTKSN
ncbi:hypothetical protein CROQUDRAFT_74277 [Cronartium quercuum f. sp. fusiforme G11]|uniref:phosphatidylserine decarboxylase n=1 Tax=Cronartium quercuum f. sp. fusiforme G11 TaxID=708437 RepID=A0A9P6NTX6_9BASI|nr:hypothetical protein CROQUDRAFT_74277 [Cronartium quercuum f. sp. fusiforme G11]